MPGQLSGSREPPSRREIGALEREIDRALAEVPAWRHIQSIIVAAAGDVLVERYFRDRRPPDLSNTHSVTKSVVASLVGLAIDGGWLSLQSTVGEVLGDRLRFGDPRKREITVRQLLTMTSGLDATSPHDIDEIADRMESWIQGALDAPLVTEPGARFAYNNGAAHLLGALLAESVGMSIPTFAEERLFAPLGIEAYRWPRDPDGYALAYGHLELRPMDMLRLGQLYLDLGRCGGAQLFTSEFVNAATSAHSNGGSPEEVAYGYLWWVAEDSGYRSFFAGGYGGQYVTVVPELQLIAVTTGDVDCFTEMSRNLRRVVTEVVLPTLTP